MRAWRMLALGLALAGSLSGSVRADPLTSDTPLTPFAFETLTVSSTAIGFTAAIMQPAGAPAPQRAFLTCETDAIRYRYDGGTPTASVGHLLNAGALANLTGAVALSQFRAIRVTTNGTCQVTYER